MSTYDEQFGWRDSVKTEIAARFNSHVKGRRFSDEASHDGAEGQWLSGLMGLKNDSKNEPDFKGFEMKKQTRGKTTFGDWSPTTALYKRNRSEFLKAFGTPNPDKEMRLSWSGEVFPKWGKTNKFGQSMSVSSNGRIEIFYSYESDLRPEKSELVPTKWQVENLVLATWTEEKLRRNLENKFDTFGWFKLLKDPSGKYNGIQFGREISWNDFVGLMTAGKVIVDCGMYEGNPRPYMQFRADPKVWDEFEEESLFFD